jgi:hypothetical protein
MIMTKATAWKQEKIIKIAGYIQAGKLRQRRVLVC